MGWLDPRARRLPPQAPGSAAPKFRESETTGLRIWICLLRWRYGGVGRKLRRIQRARGRPHRAWRKWGCAAICSGRSQNARLRSSVRIRGLGRARGCASVRRRCCRACGIHERIVDKLPIEIGFASLINDQGRLFDLAGDAYSEAAHDGAVHGLKWSESRGLRGAKTLIHALIGLIRSLIRALVGTLRGRRAGLARLRTLPLSGLLTGLAGLLRGLKSRLL